MGQRSGNRNSKSPAPGRARVLSIMFVDAVASSREMHEDEPGTVDALRGHIEFLEHAVRQHGGVSRGFRGDGIVATFQNVVDSLTCALHIQSTHNRRLESGSGRLRFRIGLHVGDVVGTGDEIFGNHIAVAARIEPLAKPGGIALSRPVYDLVNHRFDQAFVSIGTPVLKNITDELEIFQVSAGHPAPVDDARIWVPPSVAEPRVDTGSKSLPSVAVLPFEYQGGDPNYRHLADGLAEDILISLTRFRQLDVIARGSSFLLARRDLTLTELAERLRARYIVHGRLRVAGKRMRVSVDLVDPRTERTLWAESFDRAFDDIFEVQGEIAEVAVSTMAVRIDTCEREFARERNAGSFDAYSLFLRGREQILQLSPGACDAAMELFEKAAIENPSYARAQAYLSRGHSLRWKYGWTTDRDASLEAATRIAARAVDIDANDPRAHAELGWVSLYRREHERSIAAYARALQLNPSDADIIAEHADVLKHNGQADEALMRFERAIRLNPYQADPYLKDLAHTHFVREDFDAALETISKMSRPELARRVMIASHALLGHVSEAREQADLLLRDYPRFDVDTWIDMVPDRLPAHSELFKEGLKRAGL